MRVYLSISTVGVVLVKTVPVWCLVRPHKIKTLIHLTWILVKD